MVEQILVFFTGAVMGSAANALIDRLPKGKSWAAGRSVCDSCGHKLGWKDLVPVVSYLGLGGRCRYCHSPIPIRNPVVEIMMGVVFVVIWNLSISGKVDFWSGLVAAGIVWVTLIIAVMDWETKLVSEAMVVMWGGLGLIYGLNNSNYTGSFEGMIAGADLLTNLGGLIVGTAIIGGIWAVSKGRAMGLGDVEIAAVMGWWLGWKNLLPGLWVAFVSGAAAGLVLVWRKRAGLKSEMPFGPFLILGSWTAFIWGDAIWKMWGL